MSQKYHYFVSVAFVNNGARTEADGVFAFDVPWNATNYDVCKRGLCDYFNVRTLTVINFFRMHKESEDDGIVSGTEAEVIQQDVESVAQ